MVEQRIITPSWAGWQNQAGIVGKVERRAESGGLLCGGFRARQSEPEAGASFSAVFLTDRPAPLFDRDPAEIEAQSDLSFAAAFTLRELLEKIAGDFSGNSRSLVVDCDHYFVTFIV